MQWRIGNGYDVHRFTDAEVPDAFITIGGVRIASKRALLAHSDGDVLVHALCDALLGALALGDIGHHFPDSDPRYRGVSSLLLLQHVMRLVTDKGWQPGNVDLTLVAQEPRFAPHVAAIRASLAAALAVHIDQVSVKATTTEGLGFTGRREGIACYAVALLQQGSGA
ncbi:MAG TPA: 2-C-methyl-D-erythritol 2,4-cyclodiphosphate synthase [Candidatus Acidoferrum sp.]|nr:2-C-methyl-D-erythritol 2,4-cyclodiphosphate synthase [Candidatus Acidoferrum sp.]